MRTDDSVVVEWAESGAMALTGRRDGPPLVTPAAVAAAAGAAATDLLAATSRWGKPVRVDGPALLGERAATSKATRNGSVSVGGAARFVEAADGFVVLNLPRPEDVGSLPAIIDADVDPSDWRDIAARLVVMPAQQIVDRAILLGVPASSPRSVSRPVSPGGEFHRGGHRNRSSHPLVIDLTSLWAGPLLTSLLAEAGARVIKVEGKGRPDGARRGPAEFYDLLNHNKECVTLDFAGGPDRGLLGALISAADLVVEGSRPRVMDGIGIDPGEVADEGTSWLSITGYGRHGEDAKRVGLGDDAAVAGGLFIEGEPPLFVADAVADPLAGLAGASLAADLLGTDRAAALEVPLSRAAAWASGPPAVAEVVEVTTGWGVRVGDHLIDVAEPKMRRRRPTAPSADAHGDAIRAEFRV